MTLTLNETTLRLAEVADAAFILELRTDEALSQHLNKTDSSVANQEAWLTAYKKREQAGQEYYFIIVDEQRGEPVGTVRVYNIRDGKYTSGSWIIKKGAREQIAFASDFLVTYFGMEVLRSDACAFDVRKDNKKVVAFHNRFAVRTGEDAEHFFMLMDGAAYERKKRFFLNLLGVEDLGRELVVRRD